MKKSALTLFVIFLFNLGAFSQTENKKRDCPILTVIPLPSVVNAGETMKFSAKIIGDVNLKKIKFDWSIDKGTIISGQGTDIIIVQLNDECDTTVIATVSISDEKSCQISATDAGIVGSCGHPELIDEFEDTPSNDIRARFDNLIIRLQNDPLINGYVINYGSDKQIIAREKLIKSHIKFRKYDENRIKFVNGGKEETVRTRIWLVPLSVDLDAL